MVIELGNFQINTYVQEFNIISIFTNLLELVSNKYKFHLIYFKQEVTPKLDSKIKIFEFVC